MGLLNAVRKIEVSLTRQTCNLSPQHLGETKADQDFNASLSSVVSTRPARAIRNYDLKKKKTKTNKIKCKLTS